MSKVILIVDDEPDIVEYLTAILEENGFTSYSAGSVKRGFEILEKVKPDLICLDVMMPKETGVSMYRRLRQDSALKNIPIVIISGVGQDGEFAFGSHVHDEFIAAPECCLEKPIDVDLFIQTVNSLISSQQSSSERGED